MRRRCRCGLLLLPELLGFLANGANELVAARVTAVAIADGAGGEAVLLFEGADSAVAPGLLEHFWVPFARFPQLPTEMALYREPS